jgi:predicted membrane protein
MSEDSRVRQNWWAIIVAAVVNFILEAVWYSIFYQQWLSGIGRTDAWLKGRLPIPLQFGTAVVCAVVMAAAISCVVQLTGPQTAYRGMRVATALWMGFNITVWATEYVFEVRPWSLLFINAGFWLIGMNLMGLIVGAWKTKVPAATTEESRAAVRA